LTSLQLATLDPTGAKQKMFSRHNPDSVKVGDILQVRRKNGEQPFSGVVINIRRRGVDSAFLLRGQVTRIGVEVWFKLYSPLIEGIDLVQRTEKRKRRAKLFYLRYVSPGMGRGRRRVGWWRYGGLGMGWRCGMWELWV
jgi:large subunit ribosomal protein L19